MSHPPSFRSGRKRGRQQSTTTTTAFVNNTSLFQKPRLLPSTTRCLQASTGKEKKSFSLFPLDFEVALRRQAIFPMAFAAAAAAMTAAAVGLAARAEDDELISLIVKGVLLLFCVAQCCRREVQSRPPSPLFCACSF